MEKKSAGSPAESPMPFRRPNYRLLAIGAALLVLGYGLLLVPNRFVDSRIFSVALYVAPWVILGGIGTLLYAILRR